MCRRFRSVTTISEESVIETIADSVIRERGIEGRE